MVHLLNDARYGGQVCTVFVTQSPTLRTRLTDLGECTVPIQ